MATYCESHIKGWTSLRELTWLRDTSSQMRSVVEVGSYRGRSTRALLDGCAGPVYAVDLWPRMQDFAAFLGNVGCYPRLHIIHQDSLTAAAYLPDADMIFVDADHSYRAVRADLEAWLPKTRKLICGHDHTLLHPGVRRAVREIVGEVETVGSIWFHWK